MKKIQVNFIVTEDDHTLMGKQTVIEAVLSISGERVSVKKEFAYMSAASRDWYEAVKGFVEGLQPYEQPPAEPDVLSEELPLKGGKDGADI